MRNVRRLTVITLCVASACVGSTTLRAQDAAPIASQELTASDAAPEADTALPAQWDLQTCINAITAVVRGFTTTAGDIVATDDGIAFTVRAVHNALADTCRE